MPKHIENGDYQVYKVWSILSVFDRTAGSPTFLVPHGHVEIGIPQEQWRVEYKPHIDAYSFQNIWCDSYWGWRGELAEGRRLSAELEPRYFKLVPGTGPSSYLLQVVEHENLVVDYVDDPKERYVRPCLSPLRNMYSQAWHFYNLNGEDDSALRELNSRPRLAGKRGN